ncbi:hypothetical protein H5U35_01225, partial [Candidatus Aerophobetes bacterium]|nr:hypothetical protein [Candidatus Aerophobetes bacterium]
MIYKKDIAREYGYRIILSNRYPFDVAVKVVEHFYGLWEILESSPVDFERKENIIIYTLEIPSQDKRIITYKAKTM